MLHSDNEAFIWANLLWESGNLPLELRRKTSRRNLLIVGVRTRERRANKEWPQLRLSLPRAVKRQPGAVKSGSLRHKKKGATLFQSNLPVNNDLKVLEPQEFCAFLDILFYFYYYFTS